MEFEFDASDLQGLQRVVALVGPTGVGKTEASLEMARRLNAEIVSVDSLQVYRKLDVGTAKLTDERRQEISHHLLDVVDPDEEFNAADYCRLAHDAIDDIVERGKVPLLVGGTGLYLRMLVHGIFDAPPKSEALRNEYAQIAEEKGRDVLHERLQDVDPELADKVHPNDLVRVTRGLEVYDQTGKPLSQHQREHRFRAPNYHALKVVLIRPREELYERINRRAEIMVERGLMEEYQGVLDEGYKRDLKPLQSLGYRQMGQVLAGEMEIDEALSEMQKYTRRYAKQQISWFRGEPQTHWAMAPLVDGDGRLPPTALADLRRFLEGGSPELEWAKVDPYNVER